MANKKKVYLKGLGDLFIKATRIDKPALVLSDAETIDTWDGVNGAEVSLSQAQVSEGNYSIRVASATSALSGAIFEPENPVDYSSYNEGLLLVNLFASNDSNIEVAFTDGTNKSKYRYAVESNMWNRILVDLNSPSSETGTLDWSSIEGVEVLSVSGDTGTFYVDSMQFYASLDDIGRVENVRVGCLESLGLETTDETVELRCSRNQIEQTDVASTTVNLTATVQDFDPSALALMSAGEVTTDKVTAQVESENFNVPSSAPYTYTLLKADKLRIEDGYGIWVINTVTGEMLQQTPDATIIPKGYYAINVTTGVLTFSPQDRDINVTATYNYIVNTGRTLEVKTSREFREFAIQFVIKGSNGKEALFYFPKVQSNSSTVAPNKTEFWQWEFTGSVLANELTENYYEMHIKD